MCHAALALGIVTGGVPPSAAVPSAAVQPIDPAFRDEAVAVIVRVVRDPQLARSPEPPLKPPSIDCIPKTSVHAFAARPEGTLVPR